MLHRALVLSVLGTLACVGVGSSPRSAAAEEAADKYNAAELKELVAPVALYPDVVLSSMLPASTVPNDVKAASEYLAANGGKVETVPEDKAWDKSVQAMLQYPDVLTWMKDNSTWMEQMAFAVSVQQGEVLAAVQDFRTEVQKAGNLTSNEYQTINVEDSDEGDDVIIIEPTNPEVVYVPTYEPAAVMQPGYSGYGWGWGFAAGAFTAWAFHSIGWGGSHGHGGSINVNNNWNSNNNIGNRPGAGERPGGGNIGPNRPSQWQSGNRPGQKPGGGVNRPSQRPANRPGAGAGSRPGGGGVRPPAARPSRPSTRPGAGAGGSRPSAAPKLPGGAGGGRPGAGAGAGSRPGGAGAGARPSTRPSKPSGGFSGAGGSSSRARAQSQRGGSSMRSSSRGGGGASRGGSRGGGGRSGGGRGGGGGGRGGGGRRR